MTFNATLSASDAAIYKKVLDDKADANMVAIGFFLTSTDAAAARYSEFGTSRRALSADRRELSIAYEYKTEYTIKQADATRASVSGTDLSAAIKDKVDPA
jgi:hypothetical protein